MKLSHFFIEHPRFAIVLNLFIVLGGLATMLTLPIAQYPNIVPPTIKVTTLYPGASADVIARTVATPLEQAINGVEGMEYITSQSTGNGQLTITVIFKIGSDADTDLFRTNTRVQNTLSRLPQEVQLQGVQVKKTIDDLLLGVHVYSPDGSRSPEYLSNYMIHVRDEIARLPGVADSGNASLAIRFQDHILELRRRSETPQRFDVQLISALRRHWRLIENTRGHLSVLRPKRG